MCLDLDGIDKASHYKHVNNPKSELKLPGPSGSEAGHRTCSNQSMCSSIIFLFVFLIGKEQTSFFFSPNEDAQRKKKRPVHCTFRE